MDATFSALFSGMLATVISTLEEHISQGRQRQAIELARRLKDLYQEHHDQQMILLGLGTTPRGKDDTWFHSSN